MIRNARIFKAEMPGHHATLAEHLAELPFEALRPGELERQGFVPHHASGALVTAFPGGYAFVLRTDERIIPPSVVSAELDRVEEGRREQGLPKLRKAERQEHREHIILELAKTALYRTRYTHAYYLPGPGYLIVDTAAKKPAEELAGRLVQVMEAFQTTTIHVSEVARGLSTKLREELQDELLDEPLADGPDAGMPSPPLGRFGLGDAVKLKRPGASETVTYAGVDLVTQSDEIVDQLRRGFQAIELRLRLDDTEFKLCEDFALKSFSFPEVELSEADQEAAEEDRMVAWQADVQLETAAIAGITEALVELLQYKEPETGEEAA